MKSFNIPRRVSWTSGLALILVVNVGDAKASHIISTCNDQCRVSCAGQGVNCRQAIPDGVLNVCELATDITCSAGQGPVRLYDGTDLDLLGSSIICQSGIDCGDGVRMEANGSRVFNSDTENEGVIRGRFYSAVECLSKTNSEVTGIAVEEAFAGMDNCQFVRANVVRKAGRAVFGGNYGIISSGVSTLYDRIEDNYIEDRTFGILLATGNKVVQARRNVIHTGDRGAAGFRVQGNAGAIVEDNTILAPGVAYAGTRKVIWFESGLPTAGVYRRNVCDKANPGCAECQSTVKGGEHVCAQRRAPFPDSVAPFGEISLKNLGTLLGGSVTSSGWNGSAHGAESPEGPASAVELRKCVPGSGGTTTCDIYGAAMGQVGAITINHDPGTGVDISTWSEFQSDVTGTITYIGSAPPPIGPLNVQQMTLTADQIVYLGSATPTCDGATIGSTGHCQGGGYSGTESCVVQWVGSLGNTSSNCVPSGPFGNIDPGPITLTTGAASLTATIPCNSTGSGAPGELCHCGPSGAQLKPNACPGYDCAANETCTSNPSLTCFPDSIARIGDNAPVTLVGVGCASASLNVAGAVGFPGPTAVVQAMEVEGLP